MAAAAVPKALGMRQSVYARVATVEEARSARETAKALWPELHQDLNTQVCVDFAGRFCVPISDCNAVVYVPGGK